MKSCESCSGSYAPTLTSSHAKNDHSEKIRLLIGEMYALTGAARNNTSSTDNIVMLNDPVSIRERFQHLQRNARFEIRVCERLRELTPTPISEPVASTKNLRPSVRHRAIYDTKVLAAPAGISSIRSTATRGAQIRVLAELPFSLVVADNDMAMIGMRMAGDEVEAAVFGRSILLDAVLAAFETMWRTATGYDFGTAATDDGNVVDSFDREMLALFAAGVTETGVAHRAGVSVRTVQRRMARLSERLGAATRFQTAIHAARRGWI